MLLSNAEPTARRVKILHEQQASLTRQMQGILDEVGEGDWTEKQEGEYKALEQKLNKGQLELAREQRQLEREREGTDDFSDLNVDTAQATADRGEAWDGRESSRHRLSVPGKHTFQSVFGGPRGHSPGFDANGGFASVDEFLTQIATGKGDNRLRIGAVHAVSDDPHGGFLVPETFIAELLGPTLAGSVFMSRVDVREQNVKVAHHSGFANSSTADGNPYGFAAHWTMEGGSVDYGLGDVRRIKMELNRLMMLARTTVEIDEFSESFTDQLRAVLPKAAEWGFERAVIRGTGVGQPLGFLTATQANTAGHSTIVVAKESMQAADTIVYPNLVKMFSRMHPASLPKSIWMAHPDTIPQLTKLFVTDGTTSTHVPVMTESGGQFSILTRPVHFSEHMSVLGDQGDIALVDPSQYLVAMSRRLMLDKSIHVGFLNGVDTWRLLAFMTGQPKWEKPYTPPSGQTQSWAVTLAERA